MRSGRFGVAVASYAVIVLANLVVSVLWGIGSIRLPHPLCLLRGHRMPTPTRCTTCDIPYNRVRDAGRPT